jgi:thiamine pyrophosphokinase
MKRALILANGSPPNKRLFIQSLSSTDVFICADGGANIAARFNSKPHLIIGDLDSISKETLVRFRKVKITKLKDQNSTDLEKALIAAKHYHCTDIIVLGATGGRLDHAIGNLSSLAKYSHDTHISFADNASILFPVTGSLKFCSPPGTTISLLPISQCNGIVTTGLKWNLKNESLQFGVRESTSNIVLSSPVTIKVRSGNLIVFVITNNPLSIKQSKP